MPGKKKPPNITDIRNRFRKEKADCKDLRDHYMCVCERFAFEPKPGNIIQMAQRQTLNTYARRFKYLSHLNKILFSPVKKAA